MIKFIVSLEVFVRVVKRTLILSLSCHQVIVPLPSFEAGTRRPLTKGTRAQERVRKSYGSSHQEHSVTHVACAFGEVNVASFGSRCAVCDVCVSCSFIGLPVHAASLAIQYIFDISPEFS